MCAGRAKDASASADAAGAGDAQAGQAVRVLVACEYSGIVRDAFLAEGHDAISCDFLPTESPGPHIEGDVRPLLKKPWDLVIAHPPCTHLCQLTWNASETIRRNRRLVGWI